MTDLTPERIAELKAMLAKVTPGEWSITNAIIGTANPVAHPSAVVAPQWGSVDPICGLDWTSRRDVGEQQANATFIAAAKNAMPGLLAAWGENERLLAALSAAETMLGEAADKFNVYGLNHPGGHKFTGLHAQHLDEDRAAMLALAKRMKNAELEARAALEGKQ